MIRPLMGKSARECGFAQMDLNGKIRSETLSNWNYIQKKIVSAMPSITILSAAAQLPRFLASATPRKGSIFESRGREQIYGKNK